MHRRLKFGLIGAAAAIGIVIGLSILLRPMTPREAASAALRAYEARNADLLFSLTPVEERNAYGLTKERLQLLMDMSGFGKSIVPDGKILAQDSPYDGSATVSRWYRLNGQTPGLFDVRAEMRQQRAVFATSPVTNLIYMTLFAAGAKDVSGPKPLVFLAGLTKEIDALKKIGFKGVATSDGASIIPWAELQLKFQQQYQEHQRLQANQQ